MKTGQAKHDLDGPLEDQGPQYYIDHGWEPEQGEFQAREVK